MTDLVDALSDVDARLVAVDVNVRPPQPRQLTRPQPAHQAPHPQRRTRILRDTQQPADLLGGERLALARWSGRRQQHIGRRVGLDHTAAQRVHV
jgi:hypothetical protein